MYNIKKKNFNAQKLIIQIIYTRYSVTVGAGAQIE